MRQFFFIQLLLLSLATVSAQENYSALAIESVQSVVPDSIDKFIWTGDQTWEGYVKIFFEKDDFQRKTSETTQFGGNKWTNNKRTLFEYDEIGNISKLVNQYWYDTIWGNGSQHIYTYDINGNLVVQLSQGWSNHEWVNHELIEFAFDQTNRRITKTSSNWDDEWLYSRQERYIYDSSGYLAEQQTSYYNTIWIDEQRWVYTYNSDGLRVIDLHKRYDQGVWVDFVQYLSAYDIHQNLVGIVLQTPVGSDEWMDVLRANYVYDEFASVIEYTTQSFDGGNWNNDNRYLYTYNTDRNLLTQQYQWWAGYWVNRDSSQYYYPQVMHEELPEELFDFNLYPNPVDDLLYVSMRSSLRNPSFIKIFSSQGHLVSEFTFEDTSDFEIPLKDVSPGIYLLQVQTPGKTAAVKFIRL